MNTIVDERIVSMQFDNRHFERNVSTTMSTLDKLKQKLNLSGAYKGLEDVNAAAKNVSLSPIGNAAETVGLKFNAMYSMADQAMRNITNSAMASGKRIVSALTIDPVKTGFKEYETQINAVQTILANTESKGTTIDQVNDALEALNRYADKTIYNFTEMTRNIGTFTAAGVDLDTSVNAIQGIANLAAVSGSTSQQASTAMYQLSQALSSGTVKLMDWNSVVNAGMGGEVFQNALKETARVHGIEIDNMIKSEGSFRETLKNGWLSSEILTETLSKFTMATEGLTEAEIEANREKLRSIGYTEEQIESIFKLGNTATNAATKVKTLTQLWDVMKEAAQSGWAQTWKLIVGDFEEAKALFTPLADFFTGVINNISEARNKLLETTFAKNFKGLGVALKEIFKTVTEPIDAVSEAINGVTRSLAEHEAVVDEVIIGKWGHMQERWDALTASGYDWMWVQNKVNEKMGSSVRRATDYNGAMTEQAEVQEEIATTQAQRIAQLTELSDVELKAMNLTDQQIEALRDLKSIAGQLGMTVEDVVENIDNIDGRWIFINSFKNIGKGLLDTFNAIKKAWQEIFPPKSVEEKADALFNLLGAFHKFTMAFRGLTTDEGEFTETGKNLIRTLKGVFAIIDVVTTILGGGFKIAFKAVTALLKYFNLDILDVTAGIGDALVAFRDWVDSLLDFEGLFERIGPTIDKMAESVIGWFVGMESPIQNAIDSFKAWIEVLKTSENLPKDIADGIANGIGKAFEFIRSVLSGIKSYIAGGFKIDAENPLSGFIDKLKNGVTIAVDVLRELGKIALEKVNKILVDNGFSAIPEDMISGFVNGIWSGIKRVGTALWNFATMIITTVCDILGIHSPSRVFMAIGGFLVSGLLIGLANAFPEVKTFLGGMCDTVVGIFEKFDFGKILSSVLAIGMVAGLFKMASALEALASPFEVVQHFEKVVKNFSGVLKAAKWTLYSMALKNVAISIAILAGSLILLTQFADYDKLWEAVGVIAVMAVIVGALMGLMAWLGKVSGDVGGLSKLTFSIIAVSTAMLILAGALAVINTLKPAVVGEILLQIAALLVVMIGMLNTPGAKNIKDFSVMLVALAGVVLVMSMVLKSIAKMDDTSYVRGIEGIKMIAKALIQAIAAIVGIMIAMEYVNKYFKTNASIAGIGLTLAGIAAALIAMGMAVRIMGGMKPEEIEQGLTGLYGVMVAVGLLIAAISIAAGKDAKGLGATLFGIGAAMLALVYVAKIIGNSDPLQLAIGLGGIVVLGAAILAFMHFLKPLEKDQSLKGVGATLLAVSMAIGILAGVAILLGMVDPWAALQGIAGVAAIMGMLILVMRSMKDIPDAKGTMVGLAVSIGIMAASLVVLSLIPWQDLIAPVVAMAALMGMLALAIHSMKNVSKSFGSLIVLTVAIGLIGGLLIAMGALKTENALANAGAISMILLAMVAAMSAFPKIGRVKASNLDTLIALTVIMALLGLVLAMMSALKTDNALTNAGAISILMVVITGVAAAMSKLGGFHKNILYGALGLAALTVVMGLIGAVLWGMSALEVQNGVENALVLSGLLTVLTGVAALMAPIGFFHKNIKNGAVGLAALVGVMALIGAVLWGMSALEVQNGLENAAAITLVLTALAAVALVLGLVGPMALIGVKAAYALVGLVVAIGVLAAGIGALMEKFPELEGFLDKGIPILEKMAEGLGSIIGKFITAMIGETLQLLPMLGTALSEFMMNAMPFIVGAKMVTDDVLIGAGVLAGAILALTATDLLAGIASLMTGGSSFADLGRELSLFMMNAMPFITGAKMITPSMAESVKALADTILTLTAADILDGLTSWFTGGSSLSAFGKELASFGPYLAAFATSVSGLTPDALNAMKISAEAGKTLAEMAASFPNTGGWLGKILGENDADSFGSQLEGFGTSLMSYGIAVNGIGTYIESINMSVTAAKSLSELADAIPNSGGWASTILGDNDMDTWGTQLTLFGSHLMNYGRHVSNIAQYVQPINDSVTAANGLAKLNDAVPNSGGWAATILGDNDMDTWGSNLALFGTHLMNYARSVSNIAMYTAAISASVNAAKDLSKVSDIAKNVNKWDWGKSEIVKFGESMAAFGNEMKTYASNISGINTSKLSSVTTQFVKLADLAKGIKESDFGGMSAFATSLSKLGNAGVDKFIAAFTNAHAKANVAGREFVKALVKGADDAGENNLEVSAKKMANRAADRAKEAQLGFYNAGSHLVTGFANGISANSFRAASKAAAMAKTALEAAQKVLDINSPSRAAYEMGNYFGIGFVNGVGDNVGSAYDISSNMATEARRGMSEAISKVHDFINGDFETAPVIRPVLDLTNVQAGANAIGSMLGTDKTVGVLSNINANVDSNRQNGGNDEVVASINKLRREIATMPRNTYSINGVTYDDGSNVRGAIEEIARYALRERRV